MTKKTKLLVVIGTRPEAIKLAPVVLEGRRRSAEFDLVVCLTGQHQEMLMQVVDLFEIKADYNLEVMAPNQDLYDVTGKILNGMRTVLKEVQPHYVIVQGDTTTAFVGGLSAYYEKIPVCHVEAGLRTGNILNPWPEEGNRKLIGALADWHFAPTENCRQNLLREDVAAAKIVVTGNTVIDALSQMSSRLDAEPNLQQAQIDLIEGAGFPFSRIVDGEKRYILVTGHRRESFGGGFEEICSGIKNIAEAYPDVSIVYPVHLNPNVKIPVHNLLKDLPNVHLLEPLSYLPFIMLMKEAYLILTDSGGIQEEAPTLGKPVLVMRQTTERPEGVDVGTSILIGTDSKDIFENTRTLLDDECVYRAMSQASNPYGDGQASQRCLDSLVRS